jgi:hypothetical protein
MEANYARAPNLMLKNVPWHGFASINTSSQKGRHPQVEGSGLYSLVKMLRYCVVAEVPRSRERF